MKLWLKKAHHYFYLFLVVFFCGLLYPFIYYYSKKKERYSKLNYCRKILSFVTSYFAGFIFKYHFEQQIDWTRAYIICPNHSSNLDIPALSLLVKSNYAFMGKDDLLNNPITGLFFRSVDIPVNRESKMSSFRAFKRGEEYLKKGMSLIVFPEGGIADHYPPQLEVFKNGPFRLAIEHQIPIIPVTLINIWQKMWDDGYKLGSSPGICDIRIHKPIETTGLTTDDVDLLREKVYSIIHTELKNAVK